MDATRAHILTGTLLVTVAAVLVGCTTGGTTNPTGTDPSDTGAAPHGTGLLPVWHRALSDEPDGSPLWTLDRVGFVDTSGRLVVEPTYARYLLCPGPEGDTLVVAQADDRVDVLGTDGTVVGSAQARLSGCGPLPGYATLYRVTDDEWEGWAAALPDLSRSDLPAHGVAVDDDWLLVTSYPDSTDTSPTEPPPGTTELIDRYGNHVPAAGSTGWGYFFTSDDDPLSTGEWPVPASDTDGRQGYLDRSGLWMAAPQFSLTSPFAHGYAAVSDGGSSYFVDPSFDRTGPVYDAIMPIYTVRPLFVDIVGYMVILPDGGADDPATARTGLLAPDLRVLADPATSRTDCYQSWDLPDAACLVVDGTGPRLVTLPDGASTPLPDGFTVVLSAQLVATADGTRVFRTTTGEVFDVPAPFHAVVDEGWNPGGDAFVVCESDNGLRLVLDATGAPTPLSSVEQAVTTTDGTVYFWAYAGDQQGWIDATGTWLYRESRHQLTED